MTSRKQQICLNKLCALPTNPKVWKAEGLIGEFRRRKKNVITFIGFGELGYEDQDAFNRIVENELERCDPRVDIVNTGTLITAGFENGITDVYQIAKRKGFITTGVHPSIALKSGSSYFLSDFVDQPYFVNDNTWGGYIKATIEPSATLKTLLSVSDAVIAIGGGRYTAQEIKAFRDHGKRVKYHAAEMNHHISDKWARERGEKIIDFRGEAFLALMQRPEGSLAI